MCVLFPSRHITPCPKYQTGPRLSRASIARLQCVIDSCLQDMKEADEGDQEGLQEELDQVYAELARRAESKRCK